MKEGTGITVQCIACKQKRLLGFDEAKAGQPYCEQCHMPMVVLEARASVSMKGGRSK